MMFRAVFTDLDDTLFSTRRKHGDRNGLLPAALRVDGSAVSYSAPAQSALVRWMRCCDLVVPVTARTLETFSRVLLNFKGPAVLSHGATVLGADGRTDEAWSAHVDQRRAQQLAPLEGLRQRLAQLHRDVPDLEGLDVRFAGEPGRPAYLMARAPVDAQPALKRMFEDSVSDWLAQHPGYGTVFNGRAFALLPPCIGKQHAVAYLIDKLRAQHGELLCIGAGDSLSDAPFMSLCDLALAPTRSQLWQGVNSLPGSAQLELRS